MAYSADAVITYNSIITSVISINENKNEDKTITKLKW